MVVGGGRFLGKSAALGVAEWRGDLALHDRGQTSGRAIHTRKEKITIKRTAAPVERLEGWG